jgi:hypothetical protein
MRIRKRESKSAEITDTLQICELKMCYVNIVLRETAFLIVFAFNRFCKGNFVKENLINFA